METAWLIPIFRTWLHILFGCAVFVVFFAVMGVVAAWYRSLLRQIELDKNFRNRTPEDWTR